MMNLDHKSMIKYEKSNILSIGDFSGGPLDSGPVPHPTGLIQPYCTRRVRKGRNTMATWPMEEWETKW